MAQRRLEADTSQAICRPASQCCCGCSLRFGVRTIIVFGLLRSLLLIFVAISTMVFHSSRFEFTGSTASQIFAAAMGLAGVPLMLGALWGVSAKAEAPIRLYVYYMVVVMAIDVFFILKDMVFSGPCTHLGGIVGSNGAAFACGVARIFNSCTIFFILGVEMYFIFVVMSYAEELQLGRGPDLSDLAYYNDPKARLTEGMATGSYYDAVQEYGGVLESRQQVLGGSTTIFGGKRHELRYPPPCAL